jgi:glycosyltransferase involved in cell wall biosynthesis
VENDPGTLADAIERMSTMPLRKMGKRGRQWMEAEFSWEKVAQEMLRLYGKLLSKEPA